MADLDETIAAAPIHEFQVVHRVRPGDGSAGWSQVQSEWGNAALAHDTVNAIAAQHGLDPNELVGASAEHAAEASAALGQLRDKLAGDSPPAASTEPGGTQ